MTDFDFTEKELAAVAILVAAFAEAVLCTHPGEDLPDDLWAWSFISDLTCEGYDRDEAEIIFSSLVEKGFMKYVKPNSFMLTTEAWKWAGRKYEESK